MPRTISMKLTKESIDKAVKQLQEYQKWVNKKTYKLVDELTKVGIPVIEDNIQKATYTYDGKIRSGSDTEHTTHVNISGNGNSIVANLIVNGEEIMFIEFGAGVYYNGSAGASPHPKGSANGMVIGSYGKGHGVKKVWGYYDDNGELILTHGVKATMPVYKAEMAIIEEYVNVARRVFGVDR